MRGVAGASEPCVLKARAHLASKRKFGIVRPGVLRRANPAEADMIAGWHPIATDEVLDWWRGEDVDPWVMVDADDRPVAYGELWLDPDEDEVELARLIVAPELRRRGLGQQLTRALMAKAAATGLGLTMLRTDPDNEAAIGCYLACGFTPLGPEESAEWNVGQRREWYWMTLPRPSPRS